MSVVSAEHECGGHQFTRADKSPLYLCVVCRSRHVGTCYRERFISQSAMLTDAPRVKVIHDMSSIRLRIPSSTGMYWRTFVSSAGSNFGMKLCLAACPV